MLNLDGFPFPFAAKRARFEWASVVYRAYEAIIWTGALRPFLFLAGAAGAFSHIVSPAFPLGVVRGQINEANFFGSLAREFFTMMDCADAVRAAWGAAYDLQAPARQADALALARVRPSAYGAFAGAAGGAQQWEELPRSRWERGDTWATTGETAAVLASMAAAETAAPSPLARAFARADGPVVRVMSARSFDFPGGGDASFASAARGPLAPAFPCAPLTLESPFSTPSVVRCRHEAVDLGRARAALAACGRRAPRRLPEEAPRQLILRGDTDGSRALLRDSARPRAARRPRGHL
jgi:hypothetical protein